MKNLGRLRLLLAIVLLWISLCLHNKILLFTFRQVVEEALILRRIFFDSKDEIVRASQHFKGRTHTQPREIGISPECLRDSLFDEKWPSKLT